MLSLQNKITVNSLSDLGFSIRNSFLLDGSNEYFNIDDALTPIASDQYGTWLGVIKPIDATPAGTEILISFSDTSANENLQLYITSDGKLNIFYRIAGVSKFLISTDAAAFTDNTWASFAIVQDRVLPVLYVDGVAPAQSTIISGNTTVWISPGTGLDNGRIGCRQYNGGANEMFFNGYINQIALLNDDLSAAQVLDWHNSLKPKNAQAEFSSITAFMFNPDSSGNTAEFTVTDSINSITAVSVNFEDADKQPINPY